MTKANDLGCVMEADTGNSDLDVVSNKSLFFNISV